MARRRKRSERRAAERRAAKGREQGEQTSQVQSSEAASSSKGKASKAAASSSKSGGSSRKRTLLSRDMPSWAPRLGSAGRGRQVMVGGLVVVAVVAALLVGLGSSGEETVGLTDLPSYLNQDNGLVAAREGDIAPDFELPTLDGGRFRLSDYRGHPVLLNFWASWCGPCRDEMPSLVALGQQHRDTGLVVVGVNIEEGRGPAQDFADELHIDFELPMDFQGDVTDTYLRIGPPNTYFINAVGVIESMLLGGAPFASFSAELDALLRNVNAPLGSSPLAGLKALPATLVTEETAVGRSTGEVAADFLLDDAERDAVWRLSDQRGGPVAVIFLPPECSDCAASTIAAVELSVAAGLVTVLVAEGTESVSVLGVARLSWQSEVAAYFSASERSRFLVVDGSGVIATLTSSVEGLEPVLATLSAEVVAAAAGEASG